jgi:hypothetical protein
MQGDSFPSRELALVYLGMFYIATPRLRMPPDDPNPINYLREIGAAFKLGSGVLGKSAIAVGLFLVVVGIAVFRLKSDAAILLALGVMFAAFFLWFFPVIRFVEKHPEAALLESADWMEFHRFQAQTKGHIPATVDIVQTASADEALTITVAPKAPEEPQG